MARTYSLKSVTDKNGQSVALAACYAYNATDPNNLTLVETQYTDANGNATFVALPDTGTIDVNVQWGSGNNYWVYDVGDVTSDSLIDAVNKKHTQGTDTTLGTVTANIDMNSHKLTNALNPTGDYDYATKHYVDTAAVVGSIGMDAFLYLNMPTGYCLWLNDVTGELFVNLSNAADPSVGGTPVTQGFKWDTGSLYVYSI
jgi:hypothetical protein